ncbi:MAG: MFS transporter, partial [Saccharolobus sp.]
VPTIFGEIMHLPPSYYGILVTYINIIGIPSMILAGIISDRIGRKKMGILGSIIGIIGSIIFYYYLPFKENLLYLSLLFGFLVNLASSITPAFLAEMFKTYSRATGVGTSYNGAYLIAGWTPLIVSLLSSYISPFTAAALMASIGFLISIIGLALSQETYKMTIE